MARKASESRRNVTWRKWCSFLLSNQGQLIPESRNQKIREPPSLLVDVDVYSTVVGDFRLRIEPVLVQVYLVVVVSVCRRGFRAALLSQYVWDFEVGLL